jgi:hypothetical protein
MCQLISLFPARNLIIISTLPLSIGPQPIDVNKPYSILHYFPPSAASSRRLPVYRSNQRKTLGLQHKRLTSLPHLFMMRPS